MVPKTNKTSCQVIKYPGKFKKGLEMTLKIITPTRGIYYPLILKIKIMAEMLGSIAEKKMQMRMCMFLSYSVFEKTLRLQAVCSFNTFKKFYCAFQ